jgi:preprotein translocase subunit SecE
MTNRKAQAQQGGIGTSGGIVGFFNSIRAFFTEVKGEFHRVSWPKRQATLKSTAVVVVVTLVLAVYLGVLDVGLAEVAKRVLG